MGRAESRPVSILLCGLLMAALAGAEGAGETHSSGTHSSGTHSSETHSSRTHSSETEWAGAETPHWLVTADGERIETRGPWRVEGKRILFVAANGSLASVRLAGIDLDASRAASEPPPPLEAAPTPAQPLPKERVEPRLVLTEADIPPMARPLPPAEATAETTQEGGAAAGGAAPVEGLTVTEWRNVAEEGDALQIYGTVRNAGPRPRDAVSVVVVAYDADENELGRQPAQLQSTTLRPNESTGFRVSFPELVTFDRIEIEISD